MRAVTTICENCRGTGNSPSLWADKCAVCEGAGTLPGRVWHPLRVAMFRVFYGAAATTTATTRGPM